MRLQMAAIALVSAMLGGVFGVAVWRVQQSAPAQNPTPAAVGDHISGTEARKLAADLDVRIDAVADRMLQAGLFSFSGSVIQQWWWCGARCWRQKAECETDLEAFRKSTGTLGGQTAAQADAMTCEQQRVAFCANACWPSLEICAAMQKVRDRLEPRYMRCVGVE